MDQGRGRLHAIRCWAIALGVGVGFWPAVILLPRRARWACLRCAGRIIAVASGTRFAVAGAPPAEGPCVFVANHRSYLDGLAVVLALRRRTAFVVGGAIGRQRIAGPFLRALGFVFVGRGSALGVAAQLERLGRVLGEGTDLAGFPEGGILEGGTGPFHNGLFRAAAEQGCAVVPVGIVGSDGVLPRGSKRPRRGTVTVAFGEPILPDGRDGAAVRSLRDRARAAVVDLVDRGAAS